MLPVKPTVSESW